MPEPTTIHKWVSDCWKQDWWDGEFIGWTYYHQDWDDDDDIIFGHVVHKKVEDNMDYFWTVGTYVVEGKKEFQYGQEPTLEDALISAQQSWLKWSDVMYEENNS